MQAADEKFAGESFQLPKFLSTGRSVLSEVTNNAKMNYNLLSFTKERKQKSNFINNKKYEIMFFLLSGDDSVTLPDSTQPEEPVGGIKKTNKKYLKFIQQTATKLKQ